MTLNGPPHHEHRQQRRRPPDHRRLGRRGPGGGGRAAERRRRTERPPGCAGQVRHCSMGPFFSTSHFQKRNPICNQKKHNISLCTGLSRKVARNAYKILIITLLGLYNELKQTGRSKKCNIHPGSELVELLVKRYAGSTVVSNDKSL